jgi:hypothetical protein
MVATVQSGGKIEVMRLDLPEGAMVEVSVSPLDSGRKWTLDEILQVAAGHRSFDSAN